MSTMLELITQRLAPLTPERLDLDDDSAAHAGHSGNTGGGHYTLTVVSAVFSGHNTLTRHRMVYDCVSDLIPHTIHALSIRAYGPDEL